MREVKYHRAEKEAGALNDAIGVYALDGEDAGGATQEYKVRAVGQLGNPDLHLCFQTAPFPEVGVDGLTNEVLLAIVLDRLIGFQGGPFPCPENDRALAALTRALAWLHKRSQDRFAAGVEGKLAHLDGSTEPSQEPYGSDYVSLFHNEEEFEGERAAMADQVPAQTMTEEEALMAAEAVGEEEPDD